MYDQVLGTFFFLTEQYKFLTTFYEFDSDFFTILNECQIWFYSTNALFSGVTHLNPHDKIKARCLSKLL